VGGDQNEKIDGSVSLKVGVDIDQKTGTKYALDAGTEIHLKSGMTLTLETGTSLTLKVGGNFININSSCVYISGAMVFINSGGVAGTGSGAAPEVPKDPKEADQADPGARIALPPPKPPPAKPQFVSPAAQVMLEAAKSGTVFCEICERMAAQEAESKKSFAELSRGAVAPRLYTAPPPAEVKPPSEPAQEVAKSPAAAAQEPEEKKQKTAWVEIILVDAEGKPVPGARYRFTLPDGEVKEGTLNEHGQAGFYQIEPGNCKITFPDLDKDAWD
jgi:hypothetical protein